MEIDGSLTLDSLRQIGPSPAFLHLGQWFAPDGGQEPLTPLTAAGTNRGLLGKRFLAVREHGLSWQELKDPGIRDGTVMGIVPIDRFAGRWVALVRVMENNTAFRLHVYLLGPGDLTWVLAGENPTPDLFKRRTCMKSA